MEGILTYAFVAILAVSSSFYQLVCLLYTCESCSVVSDSLWPHGLYSPWNSLGQNTEVGSLCLLPGIFPTQGSNPGLSHCRLILYQLSHKGSPFYMCVCVCVCVCINMYWSGVAISFSRGSSQPRDWTQVSCIVGRRFTLWATREAHIHIYNI